MSSLTREELDALGDSGLSAATPYLITGVTHTQLSVARHYGGCTYQGQGYTYLPDSDELIRNDVRRWLAKHRKAQRRAPVSEDQRQQGMEL